MFKIIKLDIFSGIKTYYERLKSGSHWYTVGAGDSDWELGDKLDCLLTNPVTFRCYDLISDLMTQSKFFIDGTEVTKNPLIDLINNPNPLQSKKDFIKEYLAFKYSSGWVYQYPVKASGFKDASYIYNLNPRNVEHNKNFPTRLIFEKESLTDIKQKQFRYEEEEQKKEFNIEDVIMFFDVANGLSNNFLLNSPSKLHSIAKNIKNTNTALVAENSALRKIGRWIVGGSKIGGSSGIPIPMAGDEKQEIETNFGKYGHGNGKGDIIVTNAHVTAQSLHIPLGQTGLTESQQSNAIAILNAFGVPLELYPVTATGSTFENQKQAIVNLIQNVVQTEMDDMLNTYKSYFDYKDDIKASFEHLDVMQVIEEQKAEKALKISTSVRNLTQSGVTDIDVFFESMGVNVELGKISNGTQE